MHFCAVKKTHHIAIFASGNGSNAENLMKHFQHHSTIKMELVVCNNENAAVLQKAQQFSITSIAVTKDELKTTEKLLPIFENHKIDFVVLAGFLLQIPTWLVQKFPNRIINIHPALLPKFGGKGMFGKFVHEAVINANELESGISVHFVNEHYDEGKIIFQAKCQVDENETAESLAKKIQQLEHQHLPKIVEQLLVEKEHH